MSTRIHERLEIAESLDFEAPIEDDANESDQHEPTTASLMEPEELPNELQPSNRTRRRRNWEHLPPPRVTRSRGHLQIHSCRIKYNETTNVYTVSVKVYAARAGGPRLQEALQSSLRDQWIAEIRKEIIDSMLNSTGTLRPETIDRDKPFKLIHTTLQSTQD